MEETKEQKLLRVIAAQKWIEFADSEMWKRFVDEIINGKIIKSIKDDWWQKQFRNDNTLLRDTSKL